ncbi:MAG: tail fiber domain-containing protein [Taibaiella sp.]
MKKILLALSIAFCTAQLYAQLPVYWQTTTPGSFLISGSTIRNNGWAPNWDYANSLQKLPPNRDGYIEFSAETPVTTGVYYQIGFAKASAPSTPVVSFRIQVGNPGYIWPSSSMGSTIWSSCPQVAIGSVLRLERVGNVIRFWIKTPTSCELIYTNPPSPVTITPTEDWVVVFKPSGDGAVNSGAVNTTVSFGGSDELWGRVSPTAISPVSLTDKVGIGKVPAVELDVNGTTSISTLSGTGTALTEASSNGTLQRKAMGLATQVLSGTGSWTDISNFAPWKNAASPAGAIYFQPTSNRYVGINQTTPAANLDIVNSDCDNKPALKIANDEVLSCQAGTSDGDYIDCSATTINGLVQRFVVKSNGAVGINRAPSYFLDVAGPIRVVTTVYPSDRRFKENVKEINKPLELIRQLSGKIYTFKTKGFPAWNFDGGLQYGFIAQELKKVMPELVKEDNEGYLGVNYTMLIPVLTEAIKAQQQEIELLKQEVTSLKDNRSSQTTLAIAGVSASEAYLAQNVPNPFNQTTNISYKLPAGISAATLGIYDLNGKEIRLFQLSREATGSVTINGGDLKPGMYVYTLIIDGKYFNSKKMILTSK